MISNTKDWSAHSIGVAMYMREHAQERGLDADKMFLCGLLHDVGYLYDDNDHHNYGASMLTKVHMPFNILEAISLHSYSPQQIIEMKGEKALTPELLLLLEADGKVTHSGELVSFDERLEDCRVRHGENSKVYKVALESREYFRNKNIN